MINLDLNATTPADPAVIDALVHTMQETASNPSSIHQLGKKAKVALLKGTDLIAQFFGVRSSEVFFTSSGTESLSWILSSLPKSGHLITTEIEHAACYEPVLALQSQGYPITFLPVGSLGAPSAQLLEEAIEPNTSAILLSAANSETGVKIDLEVMAKIAEKHHIPLLIDGIGLFGKEAFSLYPGISALALSAHKFHGPLGIGLLVARKPFRLKPLFLGGAQQHSMRAGTENLPGIMGMVRAFSLLQEKQAEITKHLTKLQTLFEHSLKEKIPFIQINGEGPRVPNTSNIFFPGVSAEELLFQLDLWGVAASHGSACSSGTLELSRTLLKMGYPRQRVASSLRFSFARTTTEEEIHNALEKIVEAYQKLQAR